MMAMIPETLSPLPPAAPHLPVLLEAVLGALLPPGHTVTRVIDGTLGAGGHSRALLEHADSGSVLLGLDLDPQALAIARGVLAPLGERAQIRQASYLHMRDEAAALGWLEPEAAPGVDAILLDLGVSSMQLDTPERGFAFRHEGALDMRFDPASGAVSAADLVNTLDAEELANLFWRYGEERESRRFARAILRAREAAPITTTRALASLIAEAMPAALRRKQSIHPATRVFQALRIAVNDELTVVARALPIAINLLRPGGRLAVISFHSGEDRLVKEAFKDAATDCICPPRVPICACDHRATVRLITRRPIEATPDEAEHNPRSRSAKLRVVEKLVHSQ